MCYTGLTDLLKYFVFAILLPLKYIKISPGAEGLVRTSKLLPNF